MDHKRIWTVLGLGLALFLAPMTVLANTFDDHVAEAVSQARAAVAAGEEGNAAGIVAHAKAALDHARAAEEEQADSHVERAIRLLQDAIDHGVLNHVEPARQSAEEALAELRAAS